LVTYVGSVITEVTMHHRIIGKQNPRHPPSAAEKLADFG
jgi:hypothetical protein